MSNINTSLTVNVDNINYNSPLKNELIKVDAIPEISDLNTIEDNNFIETFQSPNFKNLSKNISTTYAK